MQFLVQVGIGIVGVMSLLLQSHISKAAFSSSFRMQRQKSVKRKEAFVEAYVPTRIPLGDDEEEENSGGSAAEVGWVFM